MAYELRDLHLTGLQVQTILSVHILHRPGEHGRMELEADLGENGGDYPIHETESGQQVVLYGDREGKRKPLFAGIITRLEAESAGRSCHVKMTAHTVSYLMDTGKKSRSFQDTSQTLGALAEQIVGEYGGEAEILFADSPLSEIAVQYEETDWQFLKRMLSGRHIPLAGSEARQKVCLYCGAAQIPQKMDVISVEEIHKDMEGLSYWQEMGEAVRDRDYILYRVKLDNCVPLYSLVEFGGNALTVAETEYCTIGSGLYEFVTLRSSAGVLEKEIYPMELVGSALEGTILNVRGEKVQIHLNIDDEHPGKDCYWFPYSTPSASADGSGWYCMPEKGDKVRIYFPSKRTGDVIAISAVSTYQPSRPAGGDKGGSPASGQGQKGRGSSSQAGQAGGDDSFGSGASGDAPAAAAAAAPPGNDAGKKEKDGKDKMGDPASKYLRVPSGQEVRLTPKGIEVRCSKGSVSIEVLKSGRINIYASDSIQISTKKDITLKAKRIMKVQCRESAYLCSQMGGSMYLSEEGKLILQGTEVHMN